MAWQEVSIPLPEEMAQRFEALGPRARADRATFEYVMRWSIQQVADAVARQADIGEEVDPVELRRQAKRLEVLAGASEALAASPAAGAA